MKKLNVKTIVTFAVLVVVMGLMVFGIGQIRTLMSSASSDVEPKSVVAVAGDDGKTATVTWTSDKESIAKIEYGTTAASLVLMSAEATPTKTHSLALTSLRPATTYYYRIRVGEEVFDNGGIPYTFKTKADATSLVTPTISPVATISPAATGSGTTTATICDSKTDYNKDGIVNSFDLVTCKKNGGTVAANPTATVVKTVTPANTKVDCNGRIADYNSDGIINGLDRVNCLQSVN